MTDDMTDADIVESLNKVASSARQKLVESEQFESFASRLMFAAREAATHGKNSVKISIPSELQVLNANELFNALRLHFKISSNDRRDIFRFEALSPNTLIFNWA